MLPAGPHVPGVAGRPCGLGVLRGVLVEVVEPLGSEILLDLTAGPATMVARVDPSVRVKVHEPLRLAMTKERLRFFDTKTELAI